MKLKITEPGWEGFSGNLGIVLFENGVSVGDVSHIEANIISGNIRVVEEESGESVGALELDADMQNKPCISQNLQTMEEILAGTPVLTPSEVSLIAELMSEPLKQYSKEELEGVADKGGIAALREIGDKLEVKGTSIAKLIELILEKQAPAAPVAEMLPEGQSDDGAGKNEGE